MKKMKEVKALQTPHKHLSPLNLPATQCEAPLWTPKKTKSVICELSRERTYTIVKPPGEEMALTPIAKKKKNLESPKEGCL